MCQENQKTQISSKFWKISLHLQTNFFFINWLPDPTFWKEERLLLLGIVLIFYKMVKTTQIWVNQTNFDLQIKSQKKKVLC